ncbi:MAG: metallophosphoesterase [Promethearchaeota archaeon]
MAFIIWFIIILLLIIGFFYPLLYLFYFILFIYPLGLILIHKYGSFQPHWNLGNDPTREINIFFRTKNKIKIILRFRKIEKINSKKNCRSNSNSKVEWNYILPTNPNLIKYNNKGIPIFNKSHDLNNTIIQNPSDNLKITEIIEKSIPRCFHYFFINELEPNSIYFYHILTAATIQTRNSNKQKKKKFNIIKKGKFYTLNSKKKFKFAVFGDFQIGEYLEIIETYFIYLIRKSNPQLIISLGDNVHRFNDLKSWRIHNTILRKLIPQIPFYTTPGNHDYGNDLGNYISKEAMMFPVINPKNIDENSDWFYSFRFNNVFFISLLSRRFHDKEFQQRQIEFLEAELKIANQMKLNKEINWIIFFTHVPWWGPPYNIKNPNDVEENFMRQNWVPLLEKYGVDLCFAGHKHSYCRVHNKIITGSMHGVRNYPEKSAPNYFLRNSHHFCLVSVDEKTLKVFPKTWFNRNLEVFKIEKTK